MIFNGIKQVTMTRFNEITDKNGYLWFVREEVSTTGENSPFYVNRYHIYFGNRKYGESWEGLYDAINSIIEAINQQSIEIGNKQNIISDLETIRSNAAKGATALQEVPSEYVTETELESKGFINAGYVTEELKMKSDTGHTHDDKYYTKTEVDDFFGNVISLETVQQMIKDATKKIDGGIINGGSTPTVDSVGEITEDNEILINEEMLSAGTYTLKYLDENDNVVDNSKPITNFTI